MTAKAIQEIFDYLDGLKKNLQRKGYLGKSSRTSDGKLVNSNVSSNFANKKELDDLKNQINDLKETLDVSKFALDANKNSGPLHRSNNDSQDAVDKEEFKLVREELFGLFDQLNIKADIMENVSNSIITFKEFGDLRKKVEETKEEIFKKNDETMISKADGQVVDDVVERIESLNRNFKILNVKFENLENENMMLKRELRTHQIESEEKELKLNQKLKQMNEQKMAVKKKEEFNIDKELGIYEGMGEIKKLDFKLDKFVEHHSIKQKRLEKRLEKVESNLERIKTRSIRTSQNDIEKELNKGGEYSIGMIGNKSSRAKIIDPLNPSDLEKIIQDCSVLKRDISSLTEVQRSIALVPPTPLKID